MTRQKKPEVEEKASSYILNIVCISMMQIYNILLELLFCFHFNTSSRDKVGGGKIEILKHTWDNNHILECEIQRLYTRTLWLYMSKKLAQGKTC